MRILPGSIRVFFLLTFVLPTMLGGAASTERTASQQKQRNLGRQKENLIKEVRHELLMLPYYSVFDNLAFKVDGDHVTLMGQVVRPTLKSDAEAAVKRVEGVARVTNNIEVLPLSPNDDRIRRAEFHAIYDTPQLDRYALGSVPPIHIIVKNGHVTLEGVVDNEADKNVAGIQANSVPGVFSVTNNLVVRK